MVEQYMFYISWDDCIDLYPNNVPNDFYIELPQTLTLAGDWSCGLLEAKYPSKNRDNEHIDSFFICCDICQESFVRGTKLPILRRCQLVQSDPIIAETFDTVNYLKITRDYLNKIRIYIRDKDLSNISFADSLFDCTLHLIKAE